jgi:hypothetical protein
MTDYAFVAADQRPWLQRLVERLFPGKWNEPPEDLEGFAPSYMVTEVVAVLDWKDRLRVLVSGKLNVSTQTKTDVVVNKMDSKSAVYVLSPYYPVRPPPSSGEGQHG